jgi:ribosomal protein S18 acetylase RimI-like enzyme
MKSRPITVDDFERMAAVLRDDEEHLLGRESRVGANDLREWLSRTDLPNDSWLYEDAGDVAALGWIDLAPGSDAAFSVNVVHHRWTGRGLGAELLERSEARARARGAARIHQITLGEDAAARELLTSHGYAETRRFYDMAIEQTAPPPPVALPVETVREDELPAFHAALDEAFRDHWEHHPSSFDDWWARHGTNPNLDLSLWYLIRDGDEIAAVTRNEGVRNGGGYIGAIGVRRPWRGRGYAKALLLHSFREFFERGMTRVTLGVDAQSPTGATHLYERVGMHVEMENVVFEKALES